MKDICGSPVSGLKVETVHCGPDVAGTETCSFYWEPANGSVCVGVSKGEMTVTSALRAK